MNNVKFQSLGKNQYFDEAYHKRQIYLHHTVSGGMSSTVSAWQSNAERVGAHVLIDGNGDTLVVVPIYAWIHHLGIRQSHFAGISKPKTNLALNQGSIAIELVNWGPVRWEDNGFVNEYQNRILMTEAETIFYPDRYRGYSRFERYTAAQLAALKDCLLWFMSLYNIPAPTDARALFDICPAALQGKAGIFTHSSVRPDKSDCHPQPELIELLNQL